MPQPNQVVMKTDTATSQNRGCGVGYYAVVCDSTGIRETYKKKKFLPIERNTTDSETLAAVFGLKNLYRIFKNERDDYIKDYAVVVESDCQHTVNRLETEEIRCNIDRLIRYYRSFCGNFRSRWIPRETNEEAHNLAQSAYREKYD